MEKIEDDKTMRIVEKLLNSAIKSREEFGETLENTIKEDLKMNVARFSEIAEITPSALYKIVSNERDPNLKTLRKIVKTIREITGEKKEGNFIAVVAARPVLDKIVKREVEIEGKKMKLKEYAANSMEEVILAAVNAERDGASALVCAPIVSSTIEKILRIPVVTIMPKGKLMEAVEIAAKKA